MMSYPCTQNWRTRIDRLPDYSLYPERTSSCDYLPYPSSCEGYLYETDEEKPRGRKICQRREKLTRKAREPLCKPPWNDSTIIQPLPKRSKSHQVWGACRKREPGSSFPCHGAKMSESDCYVIGHIVDICDDNIRSEKNKIHFTDQSNVSNNRKKSSCVGKKRFKRSHSLPPLPLADMGCQRKKAVAFYLQPVTCAKVYDPDKDWRKGRSKTKKFSSARKAKKPCRSIMKLPGRVCCKTDCWRPESDYQLFENVRSHRSSPCLYKRTPTSKHCNKKDVSKGVSVTQKSRLSSLESKAFIFLAKRLLDKSPTITPSSKNQMLKTNANDDSENRRKTHKPKINSCPCVDRDINILDDPQCSQRRGRARSTPPKAKFAQSNTPRSRPVSCKRGEKKFTKSCRTAEDYCTRAISRMGLRESKLIEKYGLSMSGSDLSCSSDPCRYCKFVEQPDIGYHPKNVCNLFNDRHAIRRNCNKNRTPWCPSQFERDFSQNQYPFSSTRWGTSDGFTRQHTPNEVTSKSSRPWSKMLNCSAACSEARLIDKYLDGDRTSTGSSVGRKAPKASGWRKDKYTPVMEDSETEVNCTKRTEDFPWCKTEASSDRIRNPSRLQNFLGTNASDRCSSSGLSQNYAGGWSKGVALSRNNLASRSLGRLSNCEGETLTVCDRGITSLKCMHPVIRMGSDTAGANTFSRGFTPPLKTASNLLIPDSCPTPASINPTQRKIATVFDNWQATRAPKSHVMASCLKEEEERLKKIGSILG